MTLYSLCRHYASRLEGCGLELEGKVRAAYYKFVQQLVKHITALSQEQLQSESFFLHLPLLFGFFQFFLRLISFNLTKITKMTTSAVTVIISNHKT